MVFGISYREELEEGVGDHVSALQQAHLPQSTVENYHQGEPFQLAGSYTQVHIIWVVCD